MSQLLARQVLDRLNMHASLVAMPGVSIVAADLKMLSIADPKSEAAKAEDRKVEMLAAYGQTPAVDSKPFAFFSGIAMIPVHGSLINRFGGSYGYVTGYNFIRRQMDLALADPDVMMIMFDCNSYGGEAAGCFELADAIYEARGAKPMVAIVDTNCYSACYAVASSADRVIVTPSGGAGSVGVVAMHMSFEKVLENFGVKVSLIYAGAHKVDGNPFEDLSDDVRADIQKGVDMSYDKFVSLVARNRGLDEKAVRDTEARVFRAEDALAAGLIDQVATPTNAVTALLNELSGSDDNQENDMSEQSNAPAGQAAAPATTTQPAAAAPAAPVTQGADAAATARAEERTRMNGIIGSEEAKGNPALANHLAMNTDLSVDQAKATLAAAGPAPAPAAAAAPAVVEGAAAAPANHFAAAMNSSQHPNVGADAANADNMQQQQKAKAGSKLLSAYKAATGSDL